MSPARVRAVDRAFWRRAAVVVMDMLRTRAVTVDDDLFVEPRHRQNLSDLHALVDDPPQTLGRLVDHIDADGFQSSVVVVAVVATLVHEQVEALLGRIHGLTTTVLRVDDVLDLLVGGDLVERSIRLREFRPRGLLVRAHLLSVGWQDMEGEAPRDHLEDRVAASTTLIGLVAGQVPVEAVSVPPMGSSPEFDA